MGVGSYYTDRKGKKRYYVQFQVAGVTYRPGKGYASRAEALREEARLRQELFHPEKLTFGAVVDQYIEHIRLHQQSEGWIKEKESFFKSHFSSWNQMPIQAITPLMIERHLTKRQNNRDLKILKAVFNFAIKREVIQKSPCSRIEEFPEDQKERYVPPISDFLKVLQAAKPYDQAFLKTVFLTAGRVGELLRLRWEDVNHLIGPGEITPSRHNEKVDSGTNGSYLILSSRKHRLGELRLRRIPLSPVLRDTLNWLQERKRSEYVFINQRTGSRFGERPDLLRGLCKKAGVKYFSWHALRHLAASQLAADGTPIIDVSRYLGHTSTHTTEIYLHSLEDGLAKAANTLSGVLTLQRI